MAGVLAYLDSFSGLVPCRVLRWTPRCRDYTTAPFSGGFLVEYTENRGGYKRGDSEWWPASRVVPRSAIRRQGGKFWIGAYSWPEVAPHLFVEAAEPLNGIAPAESRTAQRNRPGRIGIE